ncbi:MAG: histidinol-phosphatase [Solirubrobacteraceae bacterium]
MPPTRDDLALALELVDLADSITLRHFRAEGLTVDTKPDMTPVSEADTEVERAVRAHLADTRPEDAVVGEEYGVSKEGADRRWIIDPIDGTKGYVRGMPVWATLLALDDGDQLTVGVISAPALRRRWWAARGMGAFVADGFSAEPRRIHVSAVRELGDAQVTFGDLDEWEGIGRQEALLELSRRCWRTRGMGDFWSYMLVAEGAAEIAADPVVSVWDLAASQVILEEAGGRQTDLSGVPRPDGGNALATNGLLHDAALEILGV